MGTHGTTRAGCMSCASTSSTIWLPVWRLKSQVLSFVWLRPSVRASSGRSRLKQPIHQTEVVLVRAWPPRRVRTCLLRALLGAREQTLLIISCYGTTGDDHCLIERPQRSKESWIYGTRLRRCRLLICSMKTLKSDMLRVICCRCGDDQVNTNAVNYSTNNRSEEACVRRGWSRTFQICDTVGWWSYYRCCAHYHIYTPLGTTGYIRCAPMLGTKRRRKENSFWSRISATRTGFSWQRLWISSDLISVPSSS